MPTPGCRTPADEFDYCARYARAPLPRGVLSDSPQRATCASTPDERRMRRQPHSGQGRDPTSRAILTIALPCAAVLAVTLMVGRAWRDVLVSRSGEQQETEQNLLRSLGAWENARSGEPGIVLLGDSLAICRDARRGAKERVAVLREGARTEGDPEQHTGPRASRASTNRSSRPRQRDSLSQGSIRCHRRGQPPASSPRCRGSTVTNART